MNILSAIIRYCPFFSESTKRPERIFKKYFSSLVVNENELEINLQISRRLPTYLLRRVSLCRFENGALALYYRDKLDGQWINRFKNEAELNQWFLQRNFVDIWEIKERGKDKTTISYKFLNALGFEDFDLNQSLFERLAEESGAFFKIVDWNNPNKIVFLRGRLSNLTKKISFTTRNLEDLQFIGFDQPRKPTEGIDKEKFSLWSTLWKIMGVTVLALGIQAVRMTRVASNTHRASFRYFFESSIFPIGGMALTNVKSSFAQNTPSVNVGANSLNLNVVAGQSFNLTLSNLFNSTNLLRFSAGNLPSFIQYVSFPYQLVDAVTAVIDPDTGLEVPLGDRSAGSALQGNVLHSFGGVPSTNTSVYYTLNVSNPQQASAKYVLESSVTQGIVDGDYTYLAAANGYILKVNNNSIQLVSEIREQTDSITIDNNRSVLWSESDFFLNAFNISNLVSPVYLQGYTESSFTENAFLLSRYRIGWLEQDSNAITSLGKILVLNVSDLNNIEPISYINITNGDPVKMVCQSDICYVPILNDYGSLNIYDLSNRNPLLLSTYNTNTSSVTINYHEGLIFLSDLQGTIEIVDVTNGTNPQFFMQIDLSGGFTQSEDVQAYGNTLFISTTTGIAIYKLNLDRLSITPSSHDIGVYSFNVIAQDLNGGETIRQITLNVTGSNSVANPPPFLGTASLVGIAVGSTLFVAALGTGIIIALKRRTRAPIEPNFRLSTIDNSSEVDSKKAYTDIYEEVEWNDANAIKCHEDTGLNVAKDGIVGRGESGTAYICRDKVNSRFVVMKVINDPIKINQCLKEAELQKIVSGEGVLDVYHVFLVNNDCLRIFMAPAAFNGLGKLSQMIKIRHLEEHREFIARCVALDLLTGILNMMKSNVFHCDLKGDNVFVDNIGQARISDFGSAVQTHKKTASFRSDRHYQCPEILDRKPFELQKHEAWTAGMTILELLLGESATNFIEYQKYEKNKSLKSYEEHIEEIFEKIPHLANPKQGTIWFVVKNLLALDPDKRWSVSRALNEPCFPVDVFKRSDLFTRLLPKFGEDVMEENKQPDKSTYYQSSTEKELEVPIAPTIETMPPQRSKWSAYKIANANVYQKTDQV